MRCESRAPASAPRRPRPGQGAWRRVAPWLLCALVALASSGCGYVVVQVTAPPPTATPTPSTPLALGHSIAQVTCLSDKAYRVRFVLEVEGGTGQHAVYRDNESQKVYGPGGQRSITYDLEWGAGYAAVGTFYALSGDQRAESRFFVKAPDCQP